MTGEALHKIANELSWVLGPDVCTTIIDTNSAEIMKSVAEQLGLPFRTIAESGQKYSFKHPGLPKMCQGVLEEGKVVISINYDKAPETMPIFWEEVEKIRAEKSS